MRKIFKFGMLGLALACVSLSAAQVGGDARQGSGTGKDQGSVGFIQDVLNGEVQFEDKGLSQPMKGKRFRSTSITPQINKTNPFKKLIREHKFKREFKKGPANNLVRKPGHLPPRTSLKDSKLFPGIGATGWEPPDPDIAVGKNHVLEVVNASISWFDKDGNQQFQQPFTTFFAGQNPSTFVFDPKAFYDAATDRYFVVALDVNFDTRESNYLIGVSDDGDPNGDWFQYKFSNRTVDFFGEYWLDYPGFGFNQDTVVLSGNMFGFDGGYGGVQLHALDKAQLVNGTLRYQAFQVNPASGAFTIQWAKSNDRENPTCVGAEVYDSSRMRLYAIFKTGSIWRFRNTTVAIPSWQPDQGYAVGPGGVWVQTNDPRILSAYSKADRVVAAHTVGDLNGRGSAAWYEFTLNGWPRMVTRPALNQSGLVQPSDDRSYYCFPAISINKWNDMLMTFSRIQEDLLDDEGNVVELGSPGDVFVAARRGGDPTDWMSEPTNIQPSLGSLYQGFSSRWGDYFDVETDPLNEGKFWAVGMVTGLPGTWQTFIRSVDVQLPDGDLTELAPIAVQPWPGRYVRGNAASLAATDNNAYAVTTQLREGVHIGGVWATMPPSGEGNLRIKYTITLRNKATVVPQFMTVFGFPYAAEQTELPAGTHTRVIEISPDWAPFMDRENLIFQVLNSPVNGRIPIGTTVVIDQLVVLAPSL